MFKVGDKVRLVKRGMIGWEIKDGTDYTEVGNLLYNTAYVIERVNDGGDDDINYTDPLVWDVMLENDGDCIHPDHFTLWKLTNEERVAMRMKELQNV